LGNHPIQALIPASETPNFNNVAQVPTRILCEVRCVFQSGSKIGNNEHYTSDKAAGKPLPTGKLPNNVELAGCNKTNVKKRTNQEVHCAADPKYEKNVRLKKSLWKRLRKIGKDYQLEETYNRTRVKHSRWMPSTQTQTITKLQQLHAPVSDLREIES
jgi:hypothetical protein